MNDERDLDGISGKPIDGPIPLSPKEEAFCRAYGDPESTTYGRATRSAEAAGYIQGWNASWKLRRRPRIIDRLEQYQALARAAVGRVLSDLENERLIALAKDPPDVGAAIRATELQGKHLQMFTEAGTVTAIDLVVRREYSEAEVIEAKRITRLLLESGSPLPGLPVVPESVEVVAADPMGEARRQAKIALEAALSGRDGGQDD